MYMRAAMCGDVRLFPETFSHQGGHKEVREVEKDEKTSVDQHVLLTCACANRKRQTVQTALHSRCGLRVLISFALQNRHKAMQGFVKEAKMSDEYLESASANGKQHFT